MALLYIVGLLYLVAIRICISGIAVDGGSILREVHGAPVPAEPSSWSFPSRSMTPLVTKALIESCLLHYK